MMMLRLSKRFVLMSFFLIVIFGVLLVESCVAPVTTPEHPSVAPEIVSVKVNSDHYWWPPSYTTNPYTGETIETFPGKYVPRGTIEITIKNRPFTPYIDKDGNAINIYYTIFTRGGMAGDSLYEGFWDPVLKDFTPYAVYQSNTDYTTIIYTYSNGGGTLPHIGIMYEGIQICFRVQTVTGYFIRNEAPIDKNAVFEGEGSEPAIFEVTIPVSTGNNPKPTTTTIVPSHSTSATSNPNNPSQQKPLNTNILIIVIFVCIITILLAIIAYQHKQRKTQRSIQARTAPITLVVLV
jgi:heme/copper-type cytochrome/quinol oxidase subunit 2